MRKRSHRRSLFVVFAALLLAPAAAQTARAEPVWVRIHYQGKKVQVMGKAAKEIGDVCAELLNTSSYGAAGRAPADVEVVGKNHLAIEVDYGTYRRFGIPVGKDGQLEARYLSISLAGGTGASRNIAFVVAAWIAPEEDEDKDEGSAQYGGAVRLNNEKALAKLRELVRAQGVKVE